MLRSVLVARARSAMRGLGSTAATCGLAALAVSAAAADPPPRAPVNYVAGFAGATLDYRPHAGDWQGYQHDLVATLGYGRQVTPTVSLELDLGPTFVRGRYSSFSLVPGVVWSVHPNLYLAARFAIPVDPETNFVLLPGIGVAKPLGRLLPVLELNLSSAVGRGEPDLGVSLTAGLLVFF